MLKVLHNLQLEYPLLLEGIMNMASMEQGRQLIKALQPAGESLAGAVELAFKARPYHLEP